MSPIVGRFLGLLCISPERGNRHEPKHSPGFSLHGRGVGNSQRDGSAGSAGSAGAPGLSGAVGGLFIPPERWTTSASKTGVSGNATPTAEAEVASPSCKSFAEKFPGGRQLPTGVQRQTRQILSRSTSQTRPANGKAAFRPAHCSPRPAVGVRLSLKERHRVPGDPEVHRLWPAVRGRPAS